MTKRLKVPHDSEAEKIMKDLKVHDWAGGHGEKPNAYVYIDFAGRLAILPVSGGWLGCDKSAVEGDIAPFSD